MTCNVRQTRRLVALAIVTALLTVVVMPAVPARAAGRTLYVATDGHDYLPDGYSEAPNSFETPWRTMAMAVRRARPGDTIVVRGGTYAEAVGWGAVPGTEVNPIAIRNYENERVVLRGTLQLAGADHWTVDGINVTYDPQQGRKEALVKFAGGVGWQLLNSEIWGTRGVSNLMVIGTSQHGQPSDYRIAGNCIHDNMATGDPFMNDHNIYLQPGYQSGPGVIERNLVFNAPNGANIKAGGGDPAKTGAANVVIRYNTLATAGAGVTVSYEGHDVDVRANLIGPQEGGGQLFQSAVIGNTISGIGNVVVDNGVYGYRHTVWSTSDSTQPLGDTRSIRVNPQFDSVSCDGLHPSDAAAAAYGRYGDGDFPGTGSDTFRDDDGSTFESDVEAIARAGISRGCNPPVNDYFCPDDYVTRGQLAAFLRRSSGLPDSSVDWFIDDDDSIFESDINAMAGDGATRGCNPPDNSRFCPDDWVTRGEMAAFLTRIFAYPKSTIDYFDDDTKSTFEGDINALAKAGVTRGCNPPVNDYFCPDDYVKRKEMAAFLARALDL